MDDMYILPNVTEVQPAASFLSLPSILSAITLTVSFIGLVYWCVQDYSCFISLGPGGPPHNVYGWMLTSFIVRPFTLAADDTTWIGDYPDTGAHKEVLALPEREGQRPLIVGIAPQRQLNQCPNPEMNSRVLCLFTSVALNNPQLLQQRVSGFERHHFALFLHPSVLAKPSNLPETAIVSRGELGHIHSETSLHLYFSPADAKVIVEKGWAQRHRCARTQPWWFGGGKHMWKIGDTFLIVYAPRNEEELDVLATLIKASASFMSGEATVAAP